MNVKRAVSFVMLMLVSQRNRSQELGSHDINQHLNERRLRETDISFEDHRFSGLSIEFGVRAIRNAPTRHASASDIAKATAEDTTRKPIVRTNRK
jgi:hypothetical protein